MPLSKHTRTRLIRRNGKKVRAHRWIMEQHLGRPLLPTEEVHHINHDPLDNRIENLQLVTRQQHIALHAKEKQKYPDEKICKACGVLFKANPRKRKESKCCGRKCAQTLRVKAAMKGRGVW